MHVGKKHVDSICPKWSVDGWKEIVQENDKGKKILKDLFLGKEEMKEVQEKKYLGDIVYTDSRNRRKKTLKIGQTNLWATLTK